MKFNKNKTIRGTVYFNYAICLILFTLGKPVACVILLTMTLLAVWVWNNTNLGGPPNEKINRL